MPLLNNFTSHKISKSSCLYYVFNVTFIVTGMSASNHSLLSINMHCYLVALHQRQMTREEMSFAIDIARFILTNHNHRYYCFLFILANLLYSFLVSITWFHGRCFPSSVWPSSSSLSALFAYYSICFLILWTYEWTIMTWFFKRAGLDRFWHRVLSAKLYRNSIF